MAYRLPFWESGRTGLWYPGFPALDIPEGESFDDLEELFRWILEGGLVEAHGAFFELGLWENLQVARLGWPTIPLTSWRCSAAKAATHALPRSLEDAADNLDLLIVKDIEGSKTMKKMVKPRKPVKKERLEWCRSHAPCVVCSAKGKIKVGRAKAFTCTMCAGTGYVGKVPPMPTIWHESRELMEVLWAYCRQDVLAEESLSEALPDLVPHEIDMFHMDLAVNVRGFQLDPHALDVAEVLIDEEFVELNAELQVLTDGQVEKATQRERMIEWFGDQGLELENTQAATIDALLEKPANLAPPVYRGLELMRALGRSSTAKYETMRSWRCPDGRVRGGLLYHGAQTGRWSGKGVQPHNFPKGTVKDQDALWRLLSTLDQSRIIKEAPRNKNDQPLFTSIMEALANALRGVIIAAPGRSLFVADYAAIEARVLLWLANDQAALDIFRRGEDIYCWMASDIYGYPTNKTDHPSERALGKVAVLGLGYQMGWQKFIDTCLAMAGITIDEELAQRTVTTYREKFWRVKEMWADQEAAAIAATLDEEAGIRCGKVTWLTEGRFLYCELPSGRRLAYPDPEIHNRMMPWDKRKQTLTFMGVDTFSHQWKRQTTYGGSIVENITQAVARDILADAMLRCERSNTYSPILSIHDEIVAEAPIGVGNDEDFRKLMTELPKWAKGCPIDADGWNGTRYRK